MLEAIDVVNQLLRRWFDRGSENLAQGDPPSTAERHELPGLFQIREIRNADLTEADIPGQDADWNSWSGIPSFAASFNGYRYWGSFEACFDMGELARTRGLPDLSLTELRTDLFCLYRTVCHEGKATAEDVERGQAILAAIRDRVRRRSFD